MSWIRRIDDVDPVASADATHRELRPSTRSGTVAAGTLACARCDAPVALGGRSVTLTESLSCPFCDHVALVRDFLSLRSPTRPARVEVRVRVATRYSPDEYANVDS